MTVNALKLRLGAPDSLILDQGLSTQLDCGATSGGAILKYNPTYFEAMVDQIPLPVAAFRDKEEVAFETTLPQVQANLVNAMYAYGSTNVTTTASGTLSTPAAPTLAVVGTAGAGSYTYEIVAYTSAGDGIPSATTNIATGPAALSRANGNGIQVSFVVPAGAAGIKIIRTVGGTTQGLIATIPQPGVTQYVDYGDVAATAYTPSGANPATPNQDQFYFGGSFAVRTATLDWTVPKNDNTVNRWRGHLNKVFQAKAVELDYKRDKMVEYKVEFHALADASQPAGQQAGWLREEY